MAGKYYMSNGSTLVNLATYMTDFYGAYDGTTNPNGVNIIVSTSTNYVFTCAAVCDKTVRIHYTSGHYYVEYGDSWDGTALVNMQSITNGMHALGTMYAYHVVLNDNFILFLSQSTTVQLNSRIALIGKLTNGRFILLYLTASTSPTAYSAVHDGKLTDTNEQANVMGSLVADQTGAYVLKMPVVFRNDLVGLLTNVDGSPATIPELSITTVKYSIANPYTNTTYFITTSPLYANGLLKTEGGIMADNIVP